MNGAPVDLSFKCITRLADAVAEEPTCGLRPVKRNAEGKYLSRSLRFNNNSITGLNDLQMTLSHILAQPSKLAWLDLSFNKISHIDPVLCELRELRVLYLHGNCLYTLSEVDRLGALPLLHTLTLHGNDIESHNGYRVHVISAVPNLKMMDFSGVTPQERVFAKLWHHSSSSKALHR